MVGEAALYTQTSSQRRVSDDYSLLNAIRDRIGMIDYEKVHCWYLQ